MKSVHRIVAVLVIAASLLGSVSLIQPTGAIAAAQKAASAGLISGPWRILAHQTVMGEKLSEFGLDANPGGVWVGVVADVTNLGAAGVFDPAWLSVGATSGSPLSMTDGVTADSKRTVSATKTLQLEGISTEGTFAVTENSTVRLAAVFSLPQAPAKDEKLVIRLGDQVMSIGNTVIAKYSPSRNPEFQPAMKLLAGTINFVASDGLLNIQLLSGGAQTIRMASITTPGLNECFSTEYGQAAWAYNGSEVWIEEIPGVNADLVWTRDAVTGSLVFIGAQLVQQGFAGVSVAPTPYTNWLTAVQEWAKGQGTGLWSQCKDASGAWINPPTPTPTPVPTPSAEQIREQYTWIDARDLVIRPGSFMGKKIAIAGEVFNIQVQGNKTIMQIWVQGGNYDAVIVYFEGDSTGIYEGTWVTVYGTGAGTMDITNAYGARITQPLVAAQVVDR